MNKTRATVPDRLKPVVERLYINLGQIASLEGDVKAAETHKLLLAMAAGNDLIVIKNDVGHGNFGAWLKTNIACSARTATKYIKLADHRSLIEAQIGTSSDLSINGALRLIAQAEKPAAEAQPVPEPPAAAPSSNVSPAAHLKELRISDEERARVLAELTAADVRPELKAEIAQHAVAQERHVAEKLHKMRLKLIEDIHSAVATREDPQRLVEKVKVLLEKFDTEVARFTDWRDRVDPGSYVPIDPQQRRH